MVTNNAANNKTGASGTVLQGQGVGTASDFSTATYPSTTTSQQILYSTAANVVGQLTTANSALAATNSSGTLAMRAFSVVVQTFTSSGTYTPTSGMLYCIIECVGGGGGSGGASASGTNCAASAGGGGGEYARGVFSATTVGASQSVTIGSAGTAGSAGNNAGGNGGNTSVGSTLISANGGTASAGSATGDGTRTGGAGGTGGTGGSFRLPGQPGGQAWVVNTFGQNQTGYGGSSPFGYGGYAQNLLSTINTVAGVSGTGYGAGASGAASDSNSAAQAGAAGTAGIVVITEFVIS